MIPLVEVRLSRYVCFVPYDNYVELQHTARNTCYQIDFEVFHRLRYFNNFKKLEIDLNPWFENGVLVGPYLDTFDRHKGVKESEAGLADALKRGTSLQSPLPLGSGCSHSGRQRQAV